MKKGDMRRQELLLAAEKLFYTKGYEKTSVQDILTEMNYSKGGFYHHFDSKLSVLQAICEMRARECCEQAKKAVEQTSGGATDKLNALLHSAPLWGSDNQSFVSLLVRVAYHEDGALMRERMKQCQLEAMQPVAEAVLSEGVASGEFFCGDVSAYASLLLRLFIQFTDEIAFLLADIEKEQETLAAMVSVLDVYRSAIERVLIAPFGSIVLFDVRELQILAGSMLKDKLRERADAMLK